MGGGGQENYGLFPQFVTFSFWNAPLSMNLLPRIASILSHSTPVCYLNINLVISYTGHSVIDTLGQEMFDFFGWLFGCLGFLFSSFFSTGLPPAPTPATTPAPTTTPAPYCYCGVASRSKRITGGHETEVNAYPWMVFVLTSHGSMCGGSLISYRWVITAAHCAMVQSPDHIRVDLGQHALYDSTEAVLVRKDVIEVHHHPSFNLQQVSHDLALLKLKEGVNFLKHPHVRPICLPYPYYNNKNTYAGYEAIVSGWGMTGNTSPTSEVLMETEVDVLSNQQCKASGVPASMISDDHICASGDFENQGVCKGDSGNRNF